jgi:3-oxoacyl-[acyl-carrier-protein] synthase II
MVSVKGFGWITRKEYGSAFRGMRRDHGGPALLYAHLREEAILPLPVRNFGRFDPASKLACFAVALALWDAGLPASGDPKRDLGVVGTGARGCLQTNIDYFRDYLENGRTLARGNLFIYTLPTSPLAEAAIYFGLRGPMLFLGFPGERTAELLKTAGEMIAGGEAPGLLAVDTGEEESSCFVLMEAEGADEGARGLERAIASARKTANAGEIVEALLNGRKRER